MKHWDDEDQAAIPDPRARKATEARKLADIKRAIRDNALMSDEEIERVGYVEAVRHMGRRVTALHYWVEAEIAAVGYDWTTAEGVARLNVLQHARNEAFATRKREGAK